MCIRDRVRAREALERAEEQLRQKQSLREFKMTQASMARALSRLKGCLLYTSPLGKRESWRRNFIM